MRELVDKAKTIAKELLAKGEVDLVMGWEKGTFEDKTSPLFMRKPEDVDKLVINEFCFNSLAPYLLYYKNHQGKIALFVKGCDSRGVVRLIQDEQVKRDKIYLIGVPCTGMMELNHEGQLVDAAKCRGCTHPNPVLYDIILGEEVEAKSPGERFAAVEKETGSAREEVWKAWARNYDKCIRCYACQRICPACNCRECIFVDQGQEWIERRVDETENGAYSLIRAYHIAGRCVECGECERVCPVGLPIMKLNKKIAKDIEELFGPYEAGVDLEDKSPLGHFKYDDPEEFM
ncbi:MAG: 4Fe-4S dicluster domain-containing protein [Bacillota bacterium]